MSGLAAPRLVFSRENCFAISRLNSRDSGGMTLASCLACLCITLIIMSLTFKIIFATFKVTQITLKVMFSYEERLRPVRRPEYPAPNLDDDIL